MKYQPDFDLDFRRGQIGENLVGTFLEALQGGTIEVKTDYGTKRTGNVYIETWQFSKADMSDRRQSGINTTKATYWCIASPESAGFIMITTDALKNLLRQNNYPIGTQPITTGQTNGSQGRLVPLADILGALGVAPTK